MFNTILMLGLFQVLLKVQGISCHKLKVYRENWPQFIILKLKERKVKNRKGRTRDVSPNIHAYTEPVYIILFKWKIYEEAQSDLLSESKDKPIQHVSWKLRNKKKKKKENAYGEKLPQTNKLNNFRGFQFNHPTHIQLFYFT